MGPPMPFPRDTVSVPSRKSAHVSAASQPQSSKAGGGAALKSRDYAAHDNVGVAIGFRQEIRYLPLVFVVFVI